jgi:putative glycosyltransferase (TIGR04372 family)
MKKLKIIYEFFPTDHTNHNPKKNLLLYIFLVRMISYIKKYLYYIFFIPLIVIFLFFLFLLKKIILIRFGEIETRSVGHFGLPIEIYLSEQDLGINKCKIRHYDVWIKNKTVANKLLLTKWKKYLNIYPHFLKPIWIFIRKYKFLHDFLIPFRHWRNYGMRWPNIGHQHLDIYNVLDKVKCHISFSQEEELKASKFLLDNNIDKKFIIFFARDSAYREDELKIKYDGAEFRNSPIELQSEAIEFMCKKYKCLRMGTKQKYELIINNNNFIDYSFSKYKSDLNDLYLLSRSFFIVSTGSGFDQMGIMFRTPIVLINAVENEYRYNPLYNSPIKLYIPKKIFSFELNRNLTFSEIFNIGAHNLDEKKKYEQRYLKTINNTPKEILDVVVEMEKRLNNEWTETNEDIELQNEYWKINSFNQMPKFNCRIGSNFLKSNLDLLK